MTTLTLGDFIFARGELPESIGFGASQQLHVHTLVGGTRVIDAMGAVPQRQEWSGWLVGPQALARARYLKRLTESGQPLALRYAEFAYTVVIATFSAEFRVGPNLPYAIALEVISDHAAASVGARPQGFGQAIAQDLIGIAGNAAAIGDDGLSAAAGAVAAAVEGAGAAGAAPSAILSALPVIAQARARAVQLDIVASARIAGSVALSAPESGGSPVGPQALNGFGAGLMAAAEAVGQSGLLHAIMQRLGRVTRNLAAAGEGGAMLTTGSTDLYHLAAAAYGDARGWTRIAQANGLTDPVVSGIAELVIPPAAVPATAALHG